MKVLSRHVVIPLLALFTPLIAQADCTPAVNPDLNHHSTVGLHDQIIVALSFGLPADHPRFNPIADTTVMEVLILLIFYLCGMSLGRPFLFSLILRLF